MGALLAERLQKATPEERQQPTFRSHGHVQCRAQETKVSKQWGWEHEVSTFPYPNVVDQEMVGMLSDAAELRMDPSVKEI